MREPGPEDIPDSLESLIAARLDRLTARGRIAARHAAVIGRSFPIELLAAVLQDDNQKRTVEELVSHRIIRVDRPEEENRRNRPGSRAPSHADRALRSTFNHSMVRDVAYATMLLRERRRIHRAVANAIACGPWQNRYQAMLGHHRELGGERAKARSAYLAGARAARKRYAVDEAAVLYRDYLRLATRATPERLHARNEYGSTILSRMGQTEEAERQHRLAVEEASRLRLPEAQVACLAELGSLQGVTGRPSEARKTLKKALRVARRHGTRTGDLIGRLAVLETDQGCLEEAATLHRQALAIHRSSCNREAEGKVLCNLAITRHRQGRLHEADRLYQQALRIHRERDDRRTVGVILCNQAGLLQSLGRTREALSRHEEALLIAREVGDRRLEGMLLGNLAVLRKGQGLTKEALRLYREAVRIHQEVCDPRSESTLLGNVAILLRSLGRLDEARKQMEEALRLARQAGDRPGEGHLLGTLASWFHEQGGLSEADERYRKALAIHRETGEEEAEVGILVAMSAVHDERGDVRKAVAASQAALVIARAIGNRAAEGSILVNQAIRELLRSGDTRAAATLADEAEDHLMEVGAEPERARLLCARGHIRLSGGRSAADTLAKVRRLAASDWCIASGRLSASIAMLERAQAAFKAGAQLVHGFARQDVPAAPRQS